MRHVAFYAPLKPPTDPVPSGDRTIALNLMRVIGGPQSRVELVSNLRTREPNGDVVAQSKLIAKAEAEIARLIPYLRDVGASMWVTYHNYYKAPDLIGPTVADALGIPYVLIEATRAKKRLTGPHADFAARAEAATDAADLVFYFTQHDAEALMRDRPDGQLLQHLPPFIGRHEPPEKTVSRCGMAPRILSVGMMRAGDKMASYELVADALMQMGDRDWHLDIAGDGPERAAVEELFARHGSRVQFLGQRTSSELREHYAQAGIFLWPGVNEGFGMAYLEAQVAGLPVVAQDRPGVRDVVYSPIMSAVDAGADGFAAALRDMFDSGSMRKEVGDAARHAVIGQHMIAGASHTFWDAVNRMNKERRS